MSACGDPETNDQRDWYSKAPLELPNLFVRGEEASEISGFGEPILMPRLLPDGRLAGVDEQDGPSAAVTPTSAPATAPSAPETPPGAGAPAAMDTAGSL
ncbi:MAG: hypothetical protein ACRELD_07785 [Longimicrobiales bacterium]